MEKARKRAEAWDNITRNAAARKSICSPVLSQNDDILEQLFTNSKDHVYNLDEQEKFAIQQQETKINPIRGLSQLPSFKINQQAFKQNLELLAFKREQMPITERDECGEDEPE